MPNILEPIPSFGQQFAKSLGGGISQGMGAALQHAMKLQQEAAKQQAKLKANLEFVDAIDRDEGQSVGQKLTPSSKEDKFARLIGSLQEQGMDIPPERIQQAKEIFDQNPEMEQMLDQIEGNSQPRLRSLNDVERKERRISAVNPAVGKQMTQQREIRDKHTTGMQKETLPLRKEYATRARAAKRSIDNKKQMLALLKKGNIDDPLTVEAAKYLPGAIAGKILSPDTQVYRAGLFDEFGVLKTMFPGQIRVKEIELLEDKIASLDKSHEAKARLLEHGAKKLEAEQVYADAAREVEKKHPGASVLEFEGLVDQLARPKLDKLYNELIEGYDKIYLEFASPKSSYVDQNGDTYTNVPKSKLKDLFDTAKEEGLDLRILK